MNGRVEDLGAGAGGAGSAGSAVTSTSHVTKPASPNDGRGEAVQQMARLLDKYFPEEMREEVKMRVWEAAAAMLGFMVLNVKALMLLALDLFRLVVPPEEKSLAGQLVLVTGAGQNLGRELAVQLSRLGAILLLLDINEKQNNATADLVGKEGGEAHAYWCDVSDQEEVAAVAAKIRREVGHPRYVFSNAGTYEHKPFLSHSPADIRRMVDVNLLGSLWVAREFLGHMVKHNSGHLVCISSVLGYVGRQNVVPYCASKFGVKGLTEALAEEMRMERRSGVRVTAVHPFLISNISDVKPNLKFPWLFEVLETSDAAARIIRGVRRNQEEIFLPEKLKPFMVFSKVLPRKLRRLFGDYMES